MPAARTPRPSPLVAATCRHGRPRARRLRRRRQRVSDARPRTTRTGLQQPGTLRVGTLTDAPPNVFLKDGKFTGFDNDLLTAVAGKLGLKVEFVGTEFSALLAQVKNRQVRPRLLLDHHHRGAQEDGDFTNSYDFGYFGLDVPGRLGHHGLRPARGQARRRRAGHRPGRLRHQARASTRCGCPTTTARSTS